MDITVYKLELQGESPFKKVTSEMYHLFFLTITVLGSRMYLYLFLNLKKVGGYALCRVSLQYTVPVAQVNPETSARKRATRSICGTST